MPKDQKIVLISNHRSNYDPIITWQVFRNYQMAFLSKRENFKLPIYGRIIRKCCFVEIDRENARNAVKSVNRAAELVKSGEVSMGIYPEGTRSKDGTLLPFHDGVLSVARKADASLAIITITGTEKIAKNLPWHSSNVELRVLDVIPADVVKTLRTSELSATARAMIETDLKENEK